jgi:hypothetical protein
MSKTELEKLRTQNPKLLEPANPEPKPEELTRHFMFTPVLDADTIGLPVCGAFKGGRIKHQMHAVNCPDCLAMLDNLARLSETDDNAHAAALLHCKSVLPEVLNPDPVVLKEKHGTKPSRLAQKHQAAKTFLTSRGAQTPDDLPARMIGARPETFYKNLYEIGLIEEDGRRSGLSAADLAEGKTPEETMDPIFPAE